MKNLKVIYNDVVMFDSEIQEFIWTDSPNGVKVEGRVNAGKPGGGGGGGGLLDMITGLSKKATNDKRESLTSEDAVEEPAEVS